jgi:hypothetical protein
MDPPEADRLARTRREGWGSRRDLADHPKSVGGNGLRGTVIPGGGDAPIRRPGGMEVILALHRLRTDDGVTIIVHTQALP